MNDFEDGKKNRSDKKFLKGRFFSFFLSGNDKPKEKTTDDSLFSGETSFFGKEEKNNQTTTLPFKNKRRTRRLLISK